MFSFNSNSYSASTPCTLSYTGPGEGSFATIVLIMNVTSDDTMAICPFQLKKAPSIISRITVN